MTKRWAVLQGDARQVLKRVPDESVAAVVTSPPYLGLRSYDVPDVWWGGDPSCPHRVVVPFTKPGISGGTGEASRKREYSRQKSKSGELVPNFQIVPDQEQAVCQSCGAWFGQLGQEPDPKMYVSNLVEIFREVRRTLRNDGTLWLVMGDTWAGSGRGLMGDGLHSREFGTKQGTNKGTLAAGVVPAGVPRGMKPKDLMLIPFEVAKALREDGWYLRSDIVLQKPNAMPESVTDRPGKSYEHVFLLAKSAEYYYDREAVMVPTKTGKEARWDDGKNGLQSGERHTGSTRRFGPDPTKRNLRDVWSINTEPSPYEHYASFPLALVEICVLAGSRPDDLVMDPFCGIGRALIAAVKHGRRALGIDLGEDYVRFAREQLSLCNRE